MAKEKPTPEVVKGREDGVDLGIEDKMSLAEALIGKYQGAEDNWSPDD